MVRITGPSQGPCLPVGLLVGVAHVVNDASGRDSIYNYTVDSSHAPKTVTCMSKEDVGRLIFGVFSLTVAFSRMALTPPSLFIPLKITEITERANTSTTMLFMSLRGTVFA